MLTRPDPSNPGRNIWIRSYPVREIPDQTRPGRDPGRPGLTRVSGLSDHFA
eukprot:CAMPEP_0174886810 /NCGR_PEP_ID=MMETSP0167-20121228/2051_1 /TAXON_ID=38298 /ORGANISM="Rhodella maculata, Strain CCMP736" /LENGTH=50 /DNA_ID=CAMNT_0016122981 /DNA_START=160 /DNA_END=308 /DNA_ORIENTATION=+